MWGGVQRSIMAMSLVVGLEPRFVVKVLGLLEVSNSSI